MKPNLSDYAHVLLGALIGLILAVVVGVVLAVWLHAALSGLVDLKGRYPTLGLVLIYGGLVIFALFGCLLGVYLTVRNRPAALATVWRAALLLPLGAAAAIVLAVNFAKFTGYSTWPVVVMAECAIVLSVCAITVLAARRRALSASNN